MFGITIPLKWETVQKLDALAKERNTFRATLAREAILEWLERQEKGEKEA